MAASPTDDSLHSLSQLRFLDYLDYNTEDWNYEHFPTTLTCLKYTCNSTSTELPHVEFPRLAVLELYQVNSTSAPTIGEHHLLVD